METAFPRTWIGLNDDESKYYPNGNMAELCDIHIKVAARCESYRGGALEQCPR